MSFATSDPGYLAIDFGGTRIRAGWFSRDLELLRRAESPSRVEEPIPDVLKRIVDTAWRVVPSTPRMLQPGLIRAIGVSAPGPLDAAKGVILHAATLPGWQDVPLARYLSSAFGGPLAFLQNDGNLGALAEYERGAAQGADPALYLTVSTGIGGGVIIGGQLFTGANGLAPEPGHLRMFMPDGSTHPLEDLASGTAIARRAQALLAEGGESSLTAVETIDAKAVADAARAGDGLAIQVLHDAGFVFGVGLASLVHLFNPRAIVIGGSVAQAGDLFLSRAQQTLKEQALDPRLVPADLIRPAQLGDDACLIGAAIHAARSLNHD